MFRVPRVPGFIHNLYLLLTATVCSTDLGLEMTASMATKDVEVVVVAPIGVAAAGAADGSILSSKKVANFSKKP